MIIPFITAAAVLATAVQAHFQMQYPIPRGPFVEDSEPTFCDGYNDAVNNRTVFPFSNGIINMNSEHPLWTAEVLISTYQDPNNFSYFNSSSGYQVVVPFFQQSGEGLYCFPIDIAAAAVNVSGIQDGANVTIQVLFNGGDGNLYQCADLTLSANLTVPPANASSGCTNVSSSTTSTKSSAGKGVEVGTGIIVAGVLSMAMMLLSAL
ncbi:uncharacterized protein F5891DRAFT_993023 [Suillus fuscotomentosus]|uniref:Copper acquisition factor BIM1-like domain-containing protein n=2 Tax=Suillus TaxID=5379 RepID=A0AAD4ELR7_9AGAM|nr:uncharacterized protein F5891DRAFT_993023 [Suillus fuscotomentosus]KAG1908435.1 hypothetical protein F5891DRAFT_993023 [Suillus fuscotomentosus]